MSCRQCAYVLACVLPKCTTNTRPLHGTATISALLIPKMHRERPMPEFEHGLLGPCTFRLAQIYSKVKYLLDKFESDAGRIDGGFYVESSGGSGRCLLLSLVEDWSDSSECSLTQKV